MPSTIAFQILVSIQNLVVHRCIVDEGESTCVMSTLVWQKLGSPILQPSSTTLRDYDGHPTKSQGILPHVPITLAEKIVLIDIEVVNAHLDYNLLLRRSYMYAMRVVASTIFHLMMFPHDRKIMTVDQLTYHDPQGLMTLSNMIPKTDSTIDVTSTSPLLFVGPRLFVDTSMMASFPFMSLPPTRN